MELNKNNLSNTSLEIRDYRKVNDEHFKTKMEILIKLEIDKSRISFDANLHL